MIKLEDNKNIFGLGTVSGNGVVYFKKLPPKSLSTATHSSVGLPVYKDRFRYDDGFVEWTDIPYEESRIAVENYLAKRHLPFKEHSSYWGTDDVYGKPDDKNFGLEESIKKSQLKQLIKEIITILKEGMNGEWWFQDGQAVFADGDVGDMNHEAFVVDSLNRQILDHLGIDSSNFERAPDMAELQRYYPKVMAEILENIQDEFTDEEKELVKDGFAAGAVNSYLFRHPNLKDMLYYTQGQDKNGRTLDPRDYALIHWGWQRVKGNVIQTQTLTQKDLSNIVSGLYDAYHEELEETNPEAVEDDNPMGEHTFNIEVMSTKSWYTGVPFSVLEKKNPVELNPYRSRY